MAKIIFTMDTGEKYTMSNSSLRPGKPVKEDNIVGELSYILQNLLYFTADDGTLVVTKHISSARVES